MWIEVGFEQSIVAGLCNESGDAHHGQTSIVQFLWGEDMARKMEDWTF